MKRVNTVAAVILAFVCLSPASAQDSDATARLKQRNAEFTPELIHVAESVYTSVGHTVSTVSMIIGTDGLVIIDTGLDPDKGQLILSEFRKITDKPIKGIVFTHSHGDHIGGANAFIGEPKPQIWGHPNFGSEGRPLTRAGLTIQRKRGARQAGFLLPDSQRINNGVAPAQRPKGRRNAFRGNAKPTHHLQGDRHQIEIAGIKLQLVDAPGETKDQLYAWLPKQRVLFAGDNFYKSFPNLYAIRGTPQRNVQAWSNSLDHMLKENAVALVGGHTRPIIGEANVREHLTNFRDAVRFIHDKTVEGMNKGLTPDQLVEYVKLPERLASKDYLHPYYGHPEWGVRSVFSFYLGWFDGNPTTLFQLTPREEAQRMIELVGSKDKLFERAKEAFSRGDAQWTAQLVDHLLSLDSNSERARLLKADALTMLGERCITATGRNYYLTVAQELRDQ